MYPPGLWLVHELLRDINFGVPVGFNHDRNPLIPSNQPSATANPAPFAQELEHELSLNSCTSVLEFCLLSDGCYIDPEKALSTSQMVCK